MDRTALLISFVFLVVISHAGVTEVSAQASTRIVAVMSYPVTLGCSTMSGTEPVWYFNEIPITFTGPFSQVTGGLRIDSARLEHAGRYTCVDPNSPPTNLFTRDFVLLIESPPQLTVRPAPITKVVVNANLSFTCASQAMPPPSTIWLIDDSNLDVFPSFNGSTTSFLAVSTRGLPFDAYLVRCESSNSVGKTSESVSFIILRVSFSESVRINFFSNQVVTAGEVVSFQCLMESPQFTTLHWTRDRTVLSDTGNTLRVSVTGTSDTGSYCCAVNDSVVHCAYIYVQVPPVIDAFTPSIRTVSGRSISLYCHATGEEPPRITWLYRNGTVISDSDRGASSLTLDNVHAERLDRLDIECVASNSAGSARRITRITTVGSCSHNLLTDPDGDSDWIIPNGTTRSNRNSEQVFETTYSDLVNETASISHLIVVNSSIETLHLRAQVREVDTQNTTLVSRIRLSIIEDPSVEQTITSQGEQNRWNWVELYLNLPTMDNRSKITTLKVELFASSFFAQPISGVVYFDNVCLEASNLKADMSSTLSSTSLSTTSTTSSSSSSSSIQLFAIFISTAVILIVAVTVGIIILIILRYQQVGRLHLKKSGSYNKKYPLVTGITETVNEECEDPTTNTIPLINLESDFAEISDQLLERQSSFSELSQSPIISPHLHETSASTTMILADDFQKPTRSYQQLTYDVYDVSLPTDKVFQPTVKPKIVLYSTEDNFSPHASTGRTHSTFHSVLEDCPLSNKEIVTEVFDSKGGNIKIKKHDVLIHIPENAVAENHLVEVKACGNLVGPYRLPEHYERVSAFVWVSATYKFQKNIQMYLQHFCVVDNEDDIKDLCLLTANESDKILEDGDYVYMMHEDEIEYYFEAGCDECYILTKNWCTKCIAMRRKLKSSHCLSFGYLSRPISVGKNVQISFEICFCYSLSECIQTIQEQHKECILLKKAPMPFVLVKNHDICLNYPKQCSGWEVEHTGKTKIAPEDIHFQHYKYHDLEALEKINAYPPRFHLTFYNYDSMQHLSIVIKVELEKTKHQKKNKDENKILSFFINTPDYADFTHSTTVSPLDQSEPQQVNDRSPMWKEYSVFIKYFAAITHTLTDIDNLLPHFISNGIITIEDTDEVKSKPRQSDQLRQLLKHIEGPLRVNDARNVYILLDVMSTHGSISTKRLAATMRGELQSQSDYQPQQMQAIPDDKEQDTTTANPIDGSLCSEDGDNKAIILDGEYEETTDL